MKTHTVSFEERFHAAEALLTQLAREAKLYLDLLAIAKLNPKCITAEELETARYNLDFLATMHLVPSVPVS